MNIMVYFDMRIKGNVYMICIGHHDEPWHGSSSSPVEDIFHDHEFVKV